MSEPAYPTETNVNVDEKSRLQIEHEQSRHVLELNGIILNRLRQMNARAGQATPLPEKTDRPDDPEPSNAMDGLTQNLKKIQSFADQSIDEISRLEKII